MGLNGFWHGHLSPNSGKSLKCDCPFGTILNAKSTTHTKVGVNLGLFVNHLYCASRAIFGTQPTTNTFFFIYDGHPPTYTSPYYRAKPPPALSSAPSSSFSPARHLFLSPFSENLGADAHQVCSFFYSHFV